MGQPDTGCLILASGSPRRKTLLTDHGYRFEVIPPDDSAECGVCSGELPPELVARLAWQKTRNVAKRYDDGLFLGADTVAECAGQILGKPKDREHAEWMLRLMRGREHHVYSAFCLWRRPNDEQVIEVVQTKLRMIDWPDDQIEEYLDSDAWEGKAGAFGYQDGLDWIEIVSGSESNVVGLPMEKLRESLTQFAPEYLPSN